MKQTSGYFLLFSILALVIEGCNNHPTPNTLVTEHTTSFDPASARKAIDKKNAAFAKAFITGDSAGMVNNYMKDGKMFPPNAEIVIGSAAIGKLVSEYLKFGIKEFRDETTALYGNEENLIEEGNYFMGDGKGNTIDKGKYIDIWRKVDGEWKVYSNLWNSSLPPVPGK